MGLEEINKSIEEQNQARMKNQGRQQKSFLGELRKIESRLIEEISEIQTEDDKKQFAEKYGFAIEDMDELLERKSEWDRAEQVKENIYDSWIRSTSGVSYENDLSKAGDEIDRTRGNFMVKISKQVMAKAINEISPEEITPELVEELRKNGYDGKSGHPVLQSYFQMYCLARENKRLKEINESSSQTILSLNETVQDLVDENNAFRSRENSLLNIINNQRRFIEKIMERMQVVSESVKRLQDTVRPKSIIEKIKEKFSKSKVKLLTAPEECDIIENGNNTVIAECTKMEAYIEQNMPRSVKDLKAENTRRRQQLRTQTREQHSDKELS